MPLSARCPECDKSYKNVPAKFAGKTIRCKACGANVRVPSEDAGDDLWDVAQVATVTLPPRPGARPKAARAPASSQGVPAWLWAVAGGLALVALVGVGLAVAWAIGRGDASDAPAEIAAVDAPSAQPAPAARPPRNAADGPPMAIVGAPAARALPSAANSAPPSDVPFARTVPPASEPSAATTVTSEPSTEALPTWTPAPELTDRLGDEILDPLVGKYLLRVPRAYEALPVQSPPPRNGVSVHVAIWAGEPRPSDALRPIVSVTMLHVPPGERRGRSLADVFSEFLAGLGSNYERFAPGPIESGRIGGLPFVRANWQAVQNTVQVRGITYFAIDGETNLVLTSQHAEPRHEEAVAIGEAAILTLRPSKPVVGE